MEDKVIAINSQGFYDGDINDFVNYHNPLAFTLSEHKQDNMRNIDVIDNYKCKAFFPATTKQRGSAVFVRNGVEAFPRHDLNQFSTDRVFEGASTEIPGKNVVITSLYRSPSSSKTDFNNVLYDFTQEISREPEKKHIIAGDFNVDSRRSSTTKQVLKNNSVKFNLRSATHVKGSCLDNFVTDFQPAKSSVMKAKCDQISDHSPIQLRLPRR